MNAESSRSHAVFALTMTRSSVDGLRSQTRARLCVVDLAGSEQAKKTKATGTRLDEAKHINKSLSALGNVIHALTSSVASPAVTSYVPYRDSKLTRLLQSSLGGNAKTYLLLTCASSACHVEESLSTLRFGARAKQMQNKPIVNRPLTSAPRTVLLETLEQKIDSLCRYIQELEKAAARRSEGCSLCADALVESGQVQQPNHEPEADDETVVVNDNQPDEPSSSDVIMQAELLTLRKAMADMQRLQQHELSHALALEQSVAQAEGVALVQLHERLAKDVERLDMQLDDADAQIAMLQQQLRQSQENEQQLQEKLRQSEATAKRMEAARDAEVEILRRRLEHMERLAKPLQVELAVTRQEQLELQRKMDQSESEGLRLREENDALRKRIHAIQVDVAHAASVASCSSSPSSLVRSKPMLRPMTVALDGSESVVTSNAIQSWWTGNNSEEEDADVVAGRANRPSVAYTGAASLTVQSNRSRLGTADLAGVRASSSRERPQLHTSGGSRPFRARLVGLLTSLEEETSSYKELLQVATDEAAATNDNDQVTSAGRQRPSACRPSGHNSRKHRLPELERHLLTADEERDKR